MKPPIRRCIAVALLVLGAFLATGVGAETLDYKVTYKGLFSGFQEVAIGDVRFDVRRTRASHDGKPVYRARLTASSANYPVVENIYPYRYDFTSYHEGRAERSLAYEQRKQTSRLRHDLVVLDWDEGRVERFAIGQHEGDREEQPAPSLQAILQRAGLPDYAGQLSLHPGEIVDPPDRTLDRLALLQQVREMPMRAGTTRVLFATDGKEVMRYVANVVGQAPLETEQGTRSAWKVRIEGFERAEDDGVPLADNQSPFPTGSAEEGAWRHPPVYLWLDTGPRRLPLRFVSRHAVGTFNVELDPASAIQSAALNASPDVPTLR